MPTTKTKWAEARKAVVVTVGARPPIFRTTIVRNRHTGKLAEVPLAPMEAPPPRRGRRWSQLRLQARRASPRRPRGRSRRSRCLLSGRGVRQERGVRLPRSETSSVTSDRRSFSSSVRRFPT